MTPKTGENKNVLPMSPARLLSSGIYLRDGVIHNFLIRLPFTAFGIQIEVAGWLSNISSLRIKFKLVPSVENVKELAERQGTQKKTQSGVEKVESLIQGD